MRKTSSLRTKLTALLVGMVLVAGLVLAVAPWTVSSDALREAVAEQLREEVGLSFDEAGRTTIAFLPAPRVKFEDVVVRAPDGSEVIRGGALRGSLAWGPLVYGRVRLTELSLAQARIVVSLDEDGRSPWEPARRRMVEYVETGSPALLDRVTLIDSNVLLVDATSAVREIIRAADLSVAWSDPAGALSVTGSAGLRGEIVTVSLSGLVPRALMTGGRSPIDLQLSGRLGRLAVTGSVSTGRDSPWLQGRVAFETRSAREVVAWSRTTLPLAPMLGALSFEGDASGAGRSISFPSIRLTLGGDRLDGALAARFDAERLSLSGTFAAETLDLTPFVAPALAATRPSDPSRDEPIRLSRLTTADLDLRLSATNARVDGVRLGELAMNLIVAPQRIETSVSRARLAGGEVRGRFALTESEASVETRFDAHALGVDLAALGREVGATWIAGRADGDIVVGGTGDTVSALLAALGGEANVTVGAGELVGLDLAEALRRFERRPLTAAQTLRSGRTPFAEAQARLVLEDGVGTLEETGFESAQLNGRVAGTLSPLSRRIDANVVVESKTRVGDGDLVSALGFGIVGPLSNVSLVPDAKALIQRSGAARFLLAPALEPTAAAAEGAPAAPTAQAR